jgi:hypothetical protein
MPQPVQSTRFACGKYHEVFNATGYDGRPFNPAFDAGGSKHKPEHDAFCVIFDALGRPSDAVPSRIISRRNSCMWT